MSAQTVHDDDPLLAALITELHELAPARVVTALAVARARIGEPTRPGLHLVRGAAQTPHDVLSDVLEWWSVFRRPVSHAEVMGGSRQRHIAGARMLAMWAAREVCGDSYPDLARVFERDHTSVMHAVRRAPEVFPADMLAEVLEYVRAGDQ